MNLYATVYNLAEHLFIDKEFNLKLECVFGIASVNEAEILRNGIVEDNSAERCVNELCNLFAVNFLCHSDFNL